MSVRVRRYAAFLAVAALPLLVACGDGGSSLSGEEGKVAKRVEMLFKNMADGKGEEACKIMLSPLDNKPMSGDSLTTCASALGKQSFTDEDKAEMRKAKVTKVTVSGDTASVDGADVTGVKDAKKGDLMKLAKVDGEWYIDFAALAGSGN